MGAMSNSTRGMEVEVTTMRMRVSGVTELGEYLRLQISCG